MLRLYRMIRVLVALQSGHQFFIVSQPSSGATPASAPASPVCAAHLSRLPPGYSSSCTLKTKLTRLHQDVDTTRRDHADNVLPARAAVS